MFAPKVCAWPNSCATADAPLIRLHYPGGRESLNGPCSPERPRPGTECVLPESTRARINSAPLHSSPYRLECRAALPVAACKHPPQTPDAVPHTARSNLRFPAPRHSTITTVFSVLLLVEQTVCSTNLRISHREILRTSSASALSAE